MRDKGGEEWLNGQPNKLIERWLKNKKGSGYHFLTAPGLNNTN